MADLNGRYYEDVPKKEKKFGAKKFYKKKSGTESKYELNKMKSEAKMEKRKIRNKSKNNPKFFEEIPREVPIEERTDKRLNILLELSSLRTEEVKLGKKAKEIRELLIKTKEGLVEVSKKIGKKLDSIGGTKWENIHIIWL